MVCFIWDSKFLITYHLSTFCDYLSVVLSNVLKNKSFNQWVVKGLFTWLHLCYFIFVHYLFTRFKGETDNHSPNGMSKYLVMNHDTKHTYSICYPVEDFCLSIIKNTNKLEYSTCREWMTENQKPSYRFQRVCLYFKNTKMC